MEGNRHFPPSHTEYMIMDDTSPVHTRPQKHKKHKKDKHPTFAIDIAPSSKKNDEMDYSASNEESSVDFMEDESPGFAAKKVFFPHNQANGIINHDKDWANDVVSITDDDVENSSSTLKSSIKFVNGLPTVVKRRTTQKFHCLQCHFEGQTKVEYQISRSLMVIMAILFLTLFWPCLAYVACSKDWKDLVHSCPKCGHIVGKRRLTNERFH